jgi:hypothetical protein
MSVLYLRILTEICQKPQRIAKPHLHGLAVGCAIHQKVTVPLHCIHTNSAILLQRRDRIIAASRERRSAMIYSAFAERDISLRDVIYALGV